MITMVGMTSTWSIPMRSISLTRACGSIAPSWCRYAFCSGVSGSEFSLRMIFLFICGPAMQMGLYPGKWPLPPPITGVSPLSQASASPRQYVLRTSSFLSSGT
jgi:hypothetical protein